MILQYDPKSQLEQQRASPQPELKLKPKAVKRPAVAALLAKPSIGLPQIDEMNSKQTLADNGFSLAVSVEEFLDTNLQNIDKESELDPTPPPEAAHTSLRGAR